MSKPSSGIVAIVVYKAATAVLLAVSSASLLLALKHAAGVYAVITTIEAFGLWCQKNWARWLVCVPNCDKTDLHGPAFLSMLTIPIDQGHLYPVVTQNVHTRI